MSLFIVRGPNWKIDIEIPSDDLTNNSGYNYVEAATRAIEIIFADKEKSKNYQITGIIQVSHPEYDINTFDDSMIDLEKFLIEENVSLGKIKFLFTPIVFANAGLYNHAEFLKNIIEK